MPRQGRAAADVDKSRTTGAAAGPPRRGTRRTGGERADEIPEIAKHLPATPSLSYIGVFRASPLERIDLIRRGIPASEAKRIFADLGLGQGLGFKALNLPTATINKKAKRGGALSAEESERIVGFARLVGQLEALVQESGDASSFDPQAWMAQWLTEPLPALGGLRPTDLVDTIEGQGLVSSALAKVQSGAYA